VSGDLVRSRSTRGDSERRFCTGFTTLSIPTGPVGVPPRAGGLSARTWSGDNARSRITDSVELSTSSSPPMTRLDLPFMLPGCDGRPFGVGRCPRVFGGDIARRNSSCSAACGGELLFATFPVAEEGRGGCPWDEGPADDFRAS
jgi:hypothetical protein